MIDKRPLLSIVVPTKDRYEYLSFLVDIFISVSDIRMEMIIQDNSDIQSKLFLEKIDSLNEERIKYYYFSDKLSVVENCDKAILNSSGEYVSMIGDDDSFTKHIIPCVEMMKKYSIDAVIPSFIFYKWPDYIRDKENTASSLQFGDIKGEFSREVKIIDPQKELFKLMKKGFINRGGLPLVYHGIVKRTTLDEIYEIGNTFFPGPSPDIANGVALSFFVKRFANIDFPIIISGASARHGGDINKLKDRVARIEDVPFLSKNVKLEWESNIPKVWTGETIWPESAIKALRYLGKDYLIRKVNFKFLQAQFIINHYKYRKYAYKITDNKIKLFLYTVFVFIRRIFGAIYRRIKKMIFGIPYLNTFTVLNLEDTIKVNNFLLEKNPIFEFKFKNKIE